MGTSLQCVAIKDSQVATWFRSKGFIADVDIYELPCQTAFESQFPFADANFYQNVALFEQQGTPKANDWSLLTTMIFPYTLKIKRLAIWGYDFLDHLNPFVHLSPG